MCEHAHAHAMATGTGVAAGGGLHERRRLNGSLCVNEVEAVCEVVWRGDERVIVWERVAWGAVLNGIVSGKNCEE